MRPLIDFLNHGFLPFVGRSTQIERLLGFWRATIDAQGIRVAMLLGEAGVGKSRLLEELMPVVADEGGAVVHLKFYPESTNPFAGLIADALRRSAAARTVLRGAPQGTLPSVADALRRLARLRPTLIVIEDLHLLTGDALGEFASLLASIADEPLSLLCAARPVDMASRGLIEPYLIEEIELKGLAEEDLRHVWEVLFGAEGDREVLALLLEATRGNALAIRSALRSGVSGGALVQDHDGGWRVNPPAFAGMMERNLELLSSGMAAHLNQEERDASAMLASLGEVFARETAAAMIGDHERMIDTLLFKGILTTTSTPSMPLAGAASHRPLLAFTHTLTHRHFVGHGAVDGTRLVGAIAAGLPLYSVLPFTLLVERALLPSSLPLATVRDAVERSLKINHQIDLGSNWELGEHAWRGAALLVGARMGEWEADKWFGHLTTLLYQRLMGLRRADPGDWEPLVRHYLHLTHDAVGRKGIEERLYALRFLSRLRWERDGVASDEAAAEASDLTAREPWVRYTHSYCYYLSYRASMALESENKVEQRRIEREMEELIASEECPDSVRSALKQTVGRSLVTLFESQEELARRFALLDELEADAGGDLLLSHLRLSLLLQTGGAGAMIDRCDHLLPVLREQGLNRSYHDCLLLSVAARSALGEPLEKLLAEGDECLGLHDGFASSRRQSRALKLVSAALLRGRVDCAAAIARLHHADAPLPLPLAIPILLAPGGAGGAAVRSMVSGAEPSSLRLLIDAAAGIAVDHPPLLAAVRDLLGSPIYLLRHLLTLRMTLDLLAAADTRRQGTLLPELLPVVRETLERTFGWLSGLSLAGWMEGLLTSHGAYLKPTIAEQWRERITELERARSGEPAERDDRMQLSLLGTITVAEPGGEPQQVRGARLRALLGLMVANRMQRKPIEREEFWILAGGGAEDMARSRKTMNQGVLRLRELLGRDMVLTDTELPRLNLDRLRVDLLDAHRLLHDAMEGAREGALMRARPALITALDLVGGEVPFPTLYDDFFEAAREEFESLLRLTVIEVGTALLREGDMDGAADVFRRGLRAIPEDEEMAVLLGDALRRQGQHVEAELTRLRASLV